MTFIGKRFFAVRDIFGEAIFERKTQLSPSRMGIIPSPESDPAKSPSNNPRFRDM